jgi:hypothetical protein
MKSLTQIVTSIKERWAPQRQSAEPAAVPAGRQMQSARRATADGFDRPTNALPLSAFAPIQRPYSGADAARFVTMAHVDATLPTSVRILNPDGSCNAKAAITDLETMIGLAGGLGRADAQRYVSGILLMLINAGDMVSDGGTTTDPSAKALIGYIVNAIPRCSALMQALRTAPVI